MTPTPKTISKNIWRRTTLFIRTGSQAYRNDNLQGRPALRDILGRPEDIWLPASFFLDSTRAGTVEKNWLSVLITLEKVSWTFKLLLTHSGSSSLANELANLHKRQQLCVNVSN